jgi:glycerophosphoryl diester phosphodiesterase
MKKKRIIIFATAIVMTAFGISYKINRKKALDYSEYIKTYSDTIVTDDFSITAHRGFSSLEIENTSPSFVLASNKDYIDYIEMDARLTKDNVIVLSHNDEVVTTNGFDKISNINYDELKNESFVYISTYRPFSFFDKEKELKALRWSNLFAREYKIPTLKEGLACCKDKKVLLDLKFNNDIETFTNILVNSLDNTDTGDIIFQSLDLDGIKYLQDNTDFNCMGLISKKEDIGRINEFQRIGIKSSLVTKEIIENSMNEGKLVAIWTINSTEELDRIIDILGDYYKDVIYITDYPDLIVTRLHDRQNIQKLVKSS